MPVPGRRCAVSASSTAKRMASTCRIRTTAATTASSACTTWSSARVPACWNTSGASAFDVTLPEGVRAAVDAALETAGHGRVLQASPVGGGCISETSRLRTSTGASLFLKWSEGDASAGIFRAEAYSLRRLAATHSLRVPAVLAVSDPETPPADGAPGESTAPAPRWLLLEWLEPGGATRTTWEQLGARLA